MTSEQIVAETVRNVGVMKKLRALALKCQREQAEDRMWARRLGRFMFTLFFVVPAVVFGSIFAYHFIQALNHQYHWF